MTLSCELCHHKPENHDYSKIPCNTCYRAAHGVNPVTDDNFLGIAKAQDYKRWGLYDEYMERYVEEDLP